MSTMSALRVFRSRLLLSTVGGLSLCLLFRYWSLRSWLQ